MQQNSLEEATKANTINISTKQKDSLPTLLFIGGIPREVSEASFIDFLSSKVEVLEFNLKQRQPQQGMCAGYGVLRTTVEGY